MLVETKDGENESDYESDFDELPSKAVVRKDDEAIDTSYKQHKSRRLFKYLTIPDKNVFIPPQ